METKNYVVAIDLGTTHVAIAVGEQTPEGLSVAALVEEPCQGVTAGLVDNIELVASAIDRAKEQIRRTLGIQITEAYAGISGHFVRCASHRDYVFTDDKLLGVSQSDVDRLFDRMRNVQAPGDEVIMERIPQNYITDNGVEVRNPVGSFSGKLTSTFNFILCAQMPIQRLELALKRSGITLKGIYANAQVLPEVVLSNDDKEEGSAVVNIGGGLTDVAIYHGGILRYVATIPIGGNAINRDIRSQSIPERYVERLKCRFGSAVMELAPDSQIHIEGRTARESKDILLKNLSSVIEARMKDIVDYVQQELQNSGYGQKLNYGLVLTGGTALLKDVDELFRRQTGLEVRLGGAEEGLTPTSAEHYSSPTAATAIALLRRGAAAGACITPIDERWLEERAEEARAQEAEAERQRKAEEEAERQSIEEELRELAREEREKQEKEQRKAELQRQLQEIKNRNNGTSTPTLAPTPTPAPAPAPIPAPAPVAPTPSTPDPIDPTPSGVKTPEESTAPTKPVERLQPKKSSDESDSEKPKRNWGNILKNAITKFNDSFTKVGDDEEI